MGRNKRSGIKMSLYDKLVSLGYHPEMVMADRNSLSITEEGKRYQLELSSRYPTVCFCIDDQIITTGIRCDKLVLVDSRSDAPSWIEIFVELKGTNVMHAVDQLRETIKNNIFSHPSNKIVLARIVASSYPSNKSNPGMEKAKIEFKNRYSCELRTLKSQQVDRV